MKTGSLRVRLLASATIWIIITLFLTGFALMRLFESQMRDRVVSGLEFDLAQLIGRLDIRPDGSLRMPQALSDPRYLQAEGRRYWQIVNTSPVPAATQDHTGATVLRSPSLRTVDLENVLKRSDPEDPLISVHRNITLSGAKLSVTVATGAEEVTRSVAELRTQVLVAMTVIGSTLIASAWLQVAVGLSPLKQLRAQLADIGRGHAQRMSGNYPDEVAPLVTEFNQVLDQRDASMERARRRAGDLAHGLKTPLTVLSSIARQLRRQGQAAEATDIDEQAEAMLRHVEQALVRARLSSGKGHAASPLAATATKVVAAIGRLPGAEVLQIEIAVPPDASVPVEQDDLTELLGNLLDNARKWARSRIRVRYEAPLLSVEDDGPGVAEADLPHIAERGRRLDESTQGSGLGLSIVADIADIYGFNVSYGRSELGGLRVEVRL